MAIVAIAILATGLVMSFDWKNGGFMDTMPRTMAFGLLLIGVVLIGYFAKVILSTLGRIAARESGPFIAAAACPACHRLIPADANLCPYCGQKIR